MRAAALILLLAASAAHGEPVKTDPLTQLEACRKQITDMEETITTMLFDDADLRAKIDRIVEQATEQQKKIDEALGRILSLQDTIDQLQLAPDEPYSDYDPENAPL